MALYPGHVASLQGIGVSENWKHEDDHPCASLQEKQQRWKRHFANILNVGSHFNKDIMQV